MNVFGEFSWLAGCDKALLLTAIFQGIATIHDKKSYIFLPKTVVFRKHHTCKITLESGKEIFRMNHI